MMDVTAKLTEAKEELNDCVQAIKNGDLETALAILDDMRRSIDSAIEVAGKAADLLH